MNTVAVKNEIVDLVANYCRRHPGRARAVGAAIRAGSGEGAVMRLIIDAIKASKGGKYTHYVATHEEFIQYMEEKLCVVFDMKKVAIERRVQLRSRLNRLAIVLAYCIMAKYQGRFMPPEVSVPELAIFWAEGGHR